MLTETERRRRWPRRGRSPSSCRRSPTLRHEADVLHRGAARVPARALEHPRRRRAGARQPAVPRRAAHPHHARPDRCRRTPRTRATGCRPTRPGIDAAIVSLDSKTGAIRAMVGGSGFVPRRERGEHGARAAPDRVEHQALHPRRGASRPARNPTTSSTARRGCRAAEPRRPEEPVRDQRRASPGDRPARPGDDVASYQLRVRPAVADRRAATGWSTPRYRMAHSPYLYRGQPKEDRAADRSRTPATPPAPTR